MELGFLLKKLIAALMMPLPFCIGLLVLGLALSFIKPRAGRLIAIAGTLCLILFSSVPFSNTLLFPLEHQYPSFTLDRRVDAVVILGNCHKVDPDIPPQAQLCGTGLYRFAEGLRIWKANPDAELFLSGFEGYESRPYAEVIAELAVSEGVPAEQIRTFSQAKDTEEEARFSAEFLHGKRFALVTSSSHMKRAMYWFKQHDLSPIPAPAHFSSSPHPQKWSIESYALEQTERAWYELLGLVWAKIKTALM
jgi:uncharacterized SAM-binding protein YcdF (DUF218 family)